MVVAPRGRWSHGIHRQGAEGDERWYSAQFLVFYLVLTPVRGMAHLTCRASLLSSVYLI